MLEQIPYPEEAKSILVCNQTQYMLDLRELQAILYYSQKADGNILEIGCHLGGTTTHLGIYNFGKYIIGLDYIGPNTTMANEQIHELPDEIGKYAKHLSNVILLNMKSATFDYAKYKNIKFIFIDADHSYPGVKKDTDKAFEYIQDQESGIIMWHDYRPHITDPWLGVQTYLEEVASYGFPIKWVDGTNLAIYEKCK